MNLSLHNVNGEDFKKLLPAMIHEIPNFDCKHASIDLVQDAYYTKDDNGKYYAVGRINVLHGKSDRITMVYFSEKLPESYFKKTLGLRYQGPTDKTKQGNNEEANSAES